jgi:predicted Zn-dependent peptidase
MLHRLPNGVGLLLDPVAGARTTALGVHVRVGTRWERAEENGVAHFLEHLLFKGAGGRDAKALAEAAEGRGVYLNAATGYERTSYVARCLAEDAPFALDLLADLLRAPHLAAADIAMEKNVVLQEIGEANDAPEDRAGVLHQAAVFPDQALGRPILGEPATVQALTREAIETFLEGALAPDRVVIAVAGGFDAPALAATAERRFGGLRAGSPRTPAPAMAAGGAAAEARKLDQSHIVLSGPAPAIGGALSVAARVAAEILGGGMSSRLFQDLREARGLAYAVEAYVEPYEDEGRLCIAAGCAPKDARELAARAADHAQALAASGPTPEELARAKRVLAAGLLMGAESLAGRADLAAAQVFAFGAVRTLDQIAAELDAVTAEDVGAVLRGFASAGRQAAAVVGPRPGLAATEVFTKAFA